MLSILSIFNKNMFKMFDLLIFDATMRNAVLMKDDITNDPEELGIIAETAVYKHIKAFYYNDSTTIGYSRGDKKDKEIDIVVKSFKFPSILIEVKYRDQSKILETDAIITEGNDKYPGLVITKRHNDYGRFSYENKSIYKIPAPAFLYLLGFVEKERLE